MGVRNWTDVFTEQQILDEQTRQTRLAESFDELVRSRPDMVTNAGGYASGYPWMQPGEVEAAVSLGIAPDSPEGQMLADISGQRQVDEGLITEDGDALPKSTFEQAFQAVTDPIKGTVRSAFTLMSAPFEESTAFITAFGTALLDGDYDPILSETWENYTQKASPSSLRLILGEAAREGGFGDIDVGSGFFVGGQIRNQREQMKQRLTLDGVWMSPGRLLAQTVTEPGTEPFNFLSGAADFAANIVADPVFWVSAGASKAARANAIFELGGTLGIRKTVNKSQAIKDFVQNPNTGGRLAGHLAQETNFTRIWDGLGRPRNRDLVRRIKDERNPHMVQQLLAEGFEDGSVRAKPISRSLPAVVSRLPGVRAVAPENVQLFGPWGALRRNGLAGVRLLHNIPGVKVDARDVDHAMATLHDYMRNAKLDDEVIGEHLYRLAGIGDGPEAKNQLFTVVKDIMGDTEGVLVANGFHRDAARKMTQIQDIVYDDARRFFIDSSTGDHVRVLGSDASWVNGQNLAKPTPQLIVETIDNVFLLPDFRDIRSATSRYGKFLNKYWEGGPVTDMLGSGARWANAVLDTAMSDIWKPLQLIRMAWTLRVIGEEQLRMAGAGLDSLAGHPLSLIAWAVGENEHKLGKLLKRVAGERGRRGLNGELFSEMTEFASAMSRGSSGWRGLPGELLTGLFRTVHKGDADYFRGWALELHHLANDPVAVRVAGGLRASEAMPGFDDLRDVGHIKEWFWSGIGRQFREEVGSIDGKESVLHSRVAADHYIDEIAARVHMKAGGRVAIGPEQTLPSGDRVARFDIEAPGHPDLIEAIGKGKIEGASLTRGGLGELTPILRAYENIGPDFVKHQAFRRQGRREGRRGEVFDTLDKITENAFNLLMTRPTNNLSRSPAFRQFYWARVSELIPHADEGTRAAIIAQANKANLPKKLIREMQDRAKKFGVIDNPISGVDDLDLFAKGFALDSTRELLYDMQRRSQWADIARNILPFGEAWKEIFVSWSKIMTQRPEKLRRFQQGIEGARGSGFIFTDDNGEEMFVYPGSGLLSKVMMGSDRTGFQLTGRLQGLNLFAGSLLPGFGPAVQIPMGQLLQDRPGVLGQVNDIVNPFGEGGNAADEVLAQVPAWARKWGKWLFGDPDRDRLYANTVMDVSRALVRRGVHNTNSPEAMDKLLRDAKKKASLLWMVRGASQFVLPTGPGLQWTTEDMQGNVWLVKSLGREYRQMIEAHGGDTAETMQEFIDKFGVENLLALQAKSRSRTLTAPTEDVAEFIKLNKADAKKYPEVVGLFAPDNPDAPFDYDFYKQQFEEGLRQQLTPNEMIALHNRFVGNVAYREQQRRAEQLGMKGSTKSVYLALVREQLAQEHPGFRSYIPTIERPDTDHLIDQLTTMSRSKKWRDTGLAEGVRVYLQARQQAQVVVDALPGNITSFKTAQKMRPLRDWLRVVADRITQEHPEFARAWVSVFQRELADDPEV